jgi:UDP:flavonoid glycosyltransferase YjiC (YdhE family)
MTRILCATNPMSGHVRPLLPVVKHLTAAGNEVMWYTSAEFGTPIRAAGARFAPIGAEVDFASALRRVAGRRGFLGLNQFALEVFLRPTLAYAAELRPLFDQFDPAVVVADTSFRAGIFLAEKRGIPSVAFATGPLNLTSADTALFGTGRRPSRHRAGRVFDRCLTRAVRAAFCGQTQEVAKQIRADLGLPPLDGYCIDWVAKVADLYLQPGIPNYEYPRRDLPPSVRFVGPMILAGVDAWWQPPDWWGDVASAAEAGRPVVFVTQGTVATAPENLLLPAIRALADSEVLVVAATAGRDPREVAPVAGRPANLRLAPFVPYDEVLKSADLMITNGGYGGMQQAFAYGVPLVVCGTSEDKREVNARVAWTGAGISLKTDRPSPRLLRRAVMRVLTEPSYRDRARRLRAAHAGYGGSAEAARAILDVAARLSTGRR